MSINNVTLTSEPVSGTSIIVGNKFFGNNNALVKLRDGSLLLTKDMEYYGTSANVIITQASGTITVTGGQTYIINNNFNGDIQWQHWSNGGTVKVNSNATITSSYMGNNCKIEVLPNAKLTVNNNIDVNGTAQFIVYTNAEALVNSINLGGTSASITNYGTFTVSLWNGAITGAVSNYAYFKSYHNVTTNASSSPTAQLINNGDWVFENDFQANKKITNYNNIHVKGNFTCNSIA